LYFTFYACWKTFEAWKVTFKAFRKTFKAFRRTFKATFKLLQRLTAQQNLDLEATLRHLDHFDASPRRLTTPAAVLYFGYTKGVFHENALGSRRPLRRRVSRPPRSAARRRRAMYGQRHLLQFLQHPRLRVPVSLLL
jgi:hypothetical protein